MVARPIEEVRGNHLRAEQAQLAMPFENIVMFADKGDAVTGARLVAQGSSMVWIVNYEGGQTARYDAATGLKRWRVLIVQSCEGHCCRSAISAGGSRCSRFAISLPDNSPSDLRREKASWQVHFADGTNVYIDALTGETLAVRTQLLAGL